MLSRICLLSKGNTDWPGTDPGRF